MPWKEAGENISYEVDTSYMASPGTVEEFVSLMGANLAMGAPFPIMGKPVWYLAKIVSQRIDRIRNQRIAKVRRGICESNVNTVK